MMSAAKATPGAPSFKKITVVLLSLWVAVWMERAARAPAKAAPKNQGQHRRACHSPLNGPLSSTCSCTSTRERVGGMRASGTTSSGQQPSYSEPSGSLLCIIMKVLARIAPNKTWGQCPNGVNRKYQNMVSLSSWSGNACSRRYTLPKARLAALAEETKPASKTRAKAVLRSRDGSTLLKSCARRTARSAASSRSAWMPRSQRGKRASQISSEGTNQQVMLTNLKCGSKGIRVWRPSTYSNPVQEKSFLAADTVPSREGKMLPLARLSSK
mmetsp:Transcript_58295/g.161179  ORF Transcript_58295/g.161179 Transcript_58295/m.161179 type:complete len:270 (-) Transcript_58295:1228-2037(-)